MQLLEEAMRAGVADVNIRLREGEYQYSLVKTIAAFQLELYLPDVKDIVGKLYGEEKTSDIQFIRKIQTILKKMEKSNIIKILPKKRPWELQRYSISSFSFQDNDKNIVSLATPEQMNKAQSLLKSALNHQERARINMVDFSLSAFFLVASFVIVVWALVQPIINPVVFILSLSASTVLSLRLGNLLSRE